MTKGIGDNKPHPAYGTASFTQSPDENQPPPSQPQATPGLAHPKGSPNSPKPISKRSIRKQSSSDSQSSDYSDDQREHDQKLLVSRLDIVYSGLAHMGEYTPEDVDRALRVIKDMKSALEKEFTEHERGSDLQDALSQFFDAAIDYLSWSLECPIQPMPIQLIEGRIQKDKLFSDAYEISQSIEEANVVTKIFLKRQATMYSNHAKKLDERVCTMREDYNHHLQSVRYRAPESVKFHVRAEMLRQTIKECFPDAKNQAAIQSTIETWVRNLMLFRGEQAAQ